MIHNWKLYTKFQVCKIKIVNKYSVHTDKQTRTDRSVKTEGPSISLSISISAVQSHGRKDAENCLNAVYIRGRNFSFPWIVCGCKFIKDW